MRSLIEFIISNVGVVVTGVGVIINLIFNIANTLYTRRVSKDGVRRKESDRLRDSVYKGLNELRGYAVKLDSLELQSQTPTQLVKEVSEINKDISKTYSLLSEYFQDFDRSKFAQGTDWAGQFEADWETVSDALNGVYPKRAGIEDVRASVRRLSQTIKRVCASTMSKIESVA